MLSISALPAKAQFYPKDLDKKMYKEYIGLGNEVDTDKVIFLADSLADVCSSAGDKESEMFFRSLIIKEYDRMDNYDTMRVLTKKMRNDAEIMGENGDYWHFWSHYMDIMSLLHQGRVIDVIDLINKMRDEAEQTQSKYGVMITMFSIGEVYRNRDDIGMAGEHYLKAYEYQKQNLPTLNPALLCAYVAEYYRRKSGRTDEELQRARELVDEGLADAPDDWIRAKLLTEKAMSLYYDHDTRAFYDAYNECDSLYRIIGNSPDFLQVTYRKYILDKNYQAAMSVANMMPNEYDRHIARYVTLKAKGDYENALQYYEKANHALNLIREQERRGDLTEISAKLGNYELVIENAALEKERTRAENKQSRFFIIALTLICLITIAVLTGVIIFNRKIKKAYIKLAQSNDQLTIARNKAQQSEMMKTMFIQNMSHEIRTPLNAIVGFANLLTYDDNEYTKDDLKKFRDLINDNCGALTRLVDNILTISDFESGKYLFEYREIYVNEMCRTAIAAAREHVKEGVDLLFTSSLDDLRKVNTDELHVLQILNNLLVNACRYTDKGEIELHASIIDDRYLQLIVSDSGPGIPEEKKDEIFQRFTKLDSFSQGSGLGLSISKMIADKLSARIYLDTSYVLGARFVLEIPI